MEVWKDYQTGKYYSIDSSNGRQSPSNRYGDEKRYFTAYSTGFPRIFSGKSVPLDRLYTVQPHKFDGYCQFPRPTEKKTQNKSPYARITNRTGRVRIKDESKIPCPLEFLGMSSPQSRSLSPRRSKHFLTQSLPRPDMNSIQDIKTSQIQRPLRDLRTAADLSTKLEFEKKTSKGYIRPKSKVKRRKLKGFFLKEFRTSGELFQVEKRLTEQTNPILYQKLKKKEEFDRKMLEKKKLGKINQNY